MAKAPAPTYAYPHPVLSPWTDDHNDDCGYAITAEQNAYVDNNGYLIARILHRVDCTILSEAVSTGVAICAIKVSSPRTLKRETHTTDTNNPLAHEIKLEPSYYVGNERSGVSVTLTPFIVAANNDLWNINEHYHPEYINAGLDNFNPGRGGLLAAGHGVKVSADDSSPESIVDISVTDAKVNLHHFIVELDNDRIIIKVNRRIYEQIQRTQIGRYEPILHSALYLHAITEALRNLGQYQDTRWTEVLTDALTKSKCPTDEEKVRSDPLYYAQILLKHPLKDTVSLLGESSYWENNEEPF